MIKPITIDVIKLAASPPKERMTLPAIEAEFKIRGKENLTEFVKVSSRSRVQERLLLSVRVTGLIHGALIRVENLRQKPQR